MKVDHRPPETGWLPDTPVVDNLLRQFAHNQAAVNEELARSRRGDVDRTEDVWLADGHSSIPYFNQAVLTRPLIDAADPVLDHIEGFFGRPRGASLLSLWPTPDLTRRGWALIGHPLLVMRAPGPLARQDRTGVTTRIATGPELLATAERIFIDGYPILDARDAPRGSELTSELVGSPLTVRIGLVDGEAVAVGISLVAHGIVNLCGGATLPAARRRGAWEALVWARAADAPDQPALAYTSDNSRPGFIRMGFLPLTRLTFWLRDQERTAGGDEPARPQPVAPTG